MTRLRVPPAHSGPYTLQEDVARDRGLTLAARAGIYGRIGYEARCRPEGCGGRRPTPTGREIGRSRTGSRPDTTAMRAIAQLAERPGQKSLATLGNHIKGL